MPPLPKPTEGGGDFKPAPAGNILGICYQIIHLGTQDTTFQGEKKTAEQVRFSWELHDPDAVMEDGRPMMISKTYTWSMHEKATLRKHLEAWRGIKFKDSDFGPGGFEIEKVLGKACLLQIIHNDKGEKVYANIANISQLPRGMKVPRMHNETVFLWLEPGEFDVGVFDKLSDRMKDTIEKSPEYQAVLDAGNSRAPVHGTRLKGEIDDEVPF
jgi:hypothetical protein